MHRAKAIALRNNRRDVLEKIAAIDNDFSVRTYADAVAWNAGALEVSGTTALCHKDGKTVRFRWEGENLLRVRGMQTLPPEYAVTLKFNDVANNATYDLGLRGRYTRDVWKMPSESSVHLEPGSDSTLGVAGETTGTIAVNRGLRGRPLDSQPWDVNARFVVFDRVFHSGVKVRESVPAKQAALVDGSSVVAYKNASDLLTLDVGGHVHHVLSLAAAGHTGVTAEQRGRAYSVRIPLHDVHVAGITRIPGSMELIEATSTKSGERPRSTGAVQVNAYLIGDRKGAPVESDEAYLPRGRYAVRASFEHWTGDIGTIKVADRMPQRLRSLAGRIYRGISRRSGTFRRSR